MVDEKSRCKIFGKDESLISKDKRIVYFKIKRIKTMKTYADLDKELKKIRHKREYDFYETNLESQKKIDEFYNEDISENDMMYRKYKLESYFDRRNVLFFPIIITIVFGLLVNLVFNKFGSISIFAEMFQTLQSKSGVSENINELKYLYIILIIVLFFLIFICIVATLPYLFILVEIGYNKISQRKYELKILEDKLNKKIEENKNGKEYNSNVRKKTKIKYIFLSFFIIIISIVFGKYWGLAYDKILLLDLFGIICGCCITKIDK